MKNIQKILNFIGYLCLFYLAYIALDFRLNNPETTETELLICFTTWEYYKYLIPYLFAMGFDIWSNDK